MLTKKKLDETSAKLGDIFKNIFVSNCKANGYVFIISTMWKKTGAFISIEENFLFKNSTTQVVKEEWILWTGTDKQCMK